ncbi:MAG: hypothetical protein GYB66_14020 [Chloroflexi bacterium]|nr:hypothetical protein [Chloroflexota bacterium]
MTDLDKLRELALQQDEPDFEGYEGIASSTPEEDDDRIFGLNAVERMFLSIGMFFVVTVLSVLILMLTDSIAIP